MENSIKFPKKSKNDHMTQQSHYLTNARENHNSTRYYSHITLLTAKTWKQSKCSSTDEQDVEHVYYGILLRHKKD